MNSAPDVFSSDSTSRPLDQSFGRKRRLKKKSDFESVYKYRCSARNAFILVFCCTNDLEWSRLGLSVGKKVGAAPLRNRWKRLIRDAFRRNRASLLPNGYDFIVIPQKPYNIPSQEEMTKAVIHLFTQAARKFTTRYHDKL